MVPWTGFLHLRLELLEQAVVVVGQMDELFGNLLLEVELRVNLLERFVVARKLPARRLAAAVLAAVGAGGVKLGQVGADLLQLLGELGERLEVAFAALDLLVEDDPVEALATFHQLLREVEVRAGR